MTNETQTRRKALARLIGVRRPSIIQACCASTDTVSTRRECKSRRYIGHSNCYASCTTPLCKNAKTRIADSASRSAHTVKWQNCAKCAKCAPNSPTCTPTCFKTRSPDLTVPTVHSFEESRLAKRRGFLASRDAVAIGHLRSRTPRTTTALVSLLAASASSSPASATSKSNCTAKYKGTSNRYPSRVAEMGTGTSHSLATMCLRSHCPRRERASAWISALRRSPRSATARPSTTLGRSRQRNANWQPRNDGWPDASVGRSDAARPSPCLRSNTSVCAVSGSTTTTRSRSILFDVSISSQSRSSTSRDWRARAWPNRSTTLGGVSSRRFSQARQNVPAASSSPWTHVAHRKNVVAAEPLFAKVSACAFTTAPLADLSKTATSTQPRMCKRGDTALGEGRAALRRSEKPIPRAPERKEGV